MKAVQQIFQEFGAVLLEPGLKPRWPGDGQEVDRSVRWSLKLILGTVHFFGVLEVNICNTENYEILIY